MVQRGSVWRASAVADLWDSLLRGMPVGSFTVSQFQADTTAMVRAIGEKQAEVEAIRAGSVSLLDGQQRTLAICIGWPWKEEMDRRIWVDFGEEGGGGRPFRLRVTTRNQPFGFQPSDASRKLTRAESRLARARFDETHPGQKDVPSYELPLSETRPHGARHPLELCTLIRDFREVNQDARVWCERTLARLSMPLPDVCARPNHRRGAGGGGCPVLDRCARRFLEERPRSATQRRLTLPCQARHINPVAPCSKNALPVGCHPASGFCSPPCCCSFPRSPAPIRKRGSSVGS